MRLPTIYEVDVFKVFRVIIYRKWVGLNLVFDRPVLQTQLVLCNLYVKHRNASNYCTSELCI